MNATQFNALTETEQLELLWTRSTYLKEVSVDGYKTIYYTIEDFIVKVTYHPDTETISNIYAAEYTG